MGLPKTHFKPERSTFWVKQLKYTPNRPQRKSCKIYTRFNLKSATPFGGSGSLVDFLMNSGIQKHFAFPSLRKRRDAKFQTNDVAMTVILGTLLGQERIFHYENIEQDPLLAAKLGLPKLPDASLLYKDIPKRLGTEDGQAAIRSAQRQVIKSILAKRSRIVVDIDSTVETVYGEQEMAAVGYNPHHHGRASFHPLLAFEAATGCCLYAELRSGTAHTAEGFAEFYQNTKQQLPPDCKIGIVRCDKGFTGEVVFKELEADGVDYVIKLKWTKPLAEMAPRLAWHCITDGDGEHIDWAEVTYQASTWSKPRRVVIVRRLDIDPEQVLCADWMWEHEAIVTTLDWDGSEVWRFYNHRGNAENHIKEAKYGFAINQFSFSNLEGNRVLQGLKLLAYNLFIWFKQEWLLPPYRNWTARRIRRYLLWLPGIIVHHARQTVLRLPATAENRFRNMMRQNIAEVPS